MAGSTSNRFPPELKARAVRMVAERPEGETEYAAIQRPATRLGVPTAEAVRKWVRKAGIDAASNIDAELPHPRVQ